MQCSVQFSHSVMSDSLRPHGLHTRLPCPSPTPGAWSDSCPLTQWCHPTISSSVIPLSSHLHLSHHQGLFQSVSSSHEVAKVLEFQLQHQSLQWTRRTDLRYDGLDGSPCSPRDSLEPSPTLQFKNISSLVHQFFMAQLSHPYMTTGKITALTRWTFISKVISLLFNMLSRLVITFLPRSKHCDLHWTNKISVLLWLGQFGKEKTL